MPAWPKPEISQLSTSDAGDAVDDAVLSGKLVVVSVPAAARAEGAAVVVEVALGIGPSDAQAGDADVRPGGADHHGRLSASLVSRAPWRPVPPAVARPG